jgi:hypothetical protein
MVYNASAQVLYSSWASTQIRHAVEVEKPKVMYDTVLVGAVFPFQMVIKNNFTYKDFKIDIVRDETRVRVAVYAGSTIFILKPDDEYAILEKLITQVR